LLDVFVSGYEAVRVYGIPIYEQVDNGAVIGTQVTDQFIVRRNSKTIVLEPI